MSAWSHVQGLAGTVLCRSGTATEVGAMAEYLDLRVHDLVALDEIELYAEVLSAVAASDRPLTLAELDDALGLQPCPAGSSAAN
jgi:hypothetical protein